MCRDVTMEPPPSSAFSPGTSRRSAFTPVVPRARDPGTREPGAGTREQRPAGAREPPLGTTEPVSGAGTREQPTGTRGLTPERSGVLPGGSREQPTGTRGLTPDRTGVPPGGTREPVTGTRPAARGNRQRISQLMQSPVFTKDVSYMFMSVEEEEEDGDEEGGLDVVTQEGDWRWVGCGDLR